MCNWIYGIDVFLKRENKNNNYLRRKICIHFYFVSCAFNKPLYATYSICTWECQRMQPQWLILSLSCS